MFKDLDPILHSQLRLAVISLLISVKEAEFTFLKEKTNAQVSIDEELSSNNYKINGIGIAINIITYRQLKRLNLDFRQSPFDD